MQFVGLKKNDIILFYTLHDKKILLHLINLVKLGFFEPSYFSAPLKKYLFHRSSRSNPSHANRAPLRSDGINITLYADQSQLDFKKMAILVLVSYEVTVQKKIKRHASAVQPALLPTFLFSPRCPNPVDCGLITEHRLTPIQMYKYGVDSYPTLHSTLDATYN